MPDPDLPSPAVYAATLVRLVTEHRAANPDEYTNVHSWEDLHGICDANEFLIEAERIIGIDASVTDRHGTDNRIDSLANHAVEIAESVLFRLGQASVVSVDCGRVNVAYEAGRITAMWVNDPIDVDAWVDTGNPGCDVSDNDSPFWAAVFDYVTSHGGRPVIEWRPN